jgi:ADP-ribose pyrophosphatase YjhB (NUDIX family)
MAWPLVELTSEELLALPAFSEVSRVAVAAVVLRDERRSLLVLRREAGDGAGEGDSEREVLEELPGGSVAADETVGDAVARVVAQATSLTVDDVGELWFGVTYEAREGATIHLTYAVEVVGADEATVVVDPFEHTSYRWVPTDDLAATHLTPTVALALTEHLAPPPPA